VAIAQALLEALVDAGARVAITTHYIQLKELAQNDRRFTVGAMEVSHIPPSLVTIEKSGSHDLVLA
jgi:dsDNA-specific endonuclease/ATPase MutS2